MVTWKSGTDMSQQFQFRKTFDQDICGWDVSKVLNMSAMYVSQCNIIQPGRQWVGCVEGVEYEFHVCFTVHHHHSTSQDISGWDVSQGKVSDDKLRALLKTLQAGNGSTFLLFEEVSKHNQPEKNANLCLLACSDGSAAEPLCTAPSN